MTEESLQRAQVLAQLGSWEWDLSTGRLEFTEEMYRLVGLWPETRPLTYRDYLAFIHPDDRRRVNARIRGVLEGKPLRVDHRLRLPDGRVRWVHCEGEAEFDAEGCAVRVIGTALDVSQQRRGIDQLQGGDLLFRKLVENAQDVLFRYRVVPDQGFDYLSPAAGYYTGLSPEQIYADPEVFFSRVHPDDRIKIARAIADPENNSPYQIRVRGRGNKWLWAEQVLVPIRDENGELVAIEGVSRDVTARKEAEAEREALMERIADERRWLGEVLSQLPGALVVVRLIEGKKSVTSNAAAKVLCGEALDCEILDMEGTPLQDGEVPSARALRGERIGPTEFRLRRTDGHEVQVVGSASPVRSSANEVVGAVVLWEDLTHIKELERLREEWTSVIAHDLRQPITMIRSYAELLSRQVGEEKQRCRVSQISDAARRLGRMIEDLLDASRLETHRLPLEKKPVHVATWLEEVIERAARQLRGALLRLRLDGAPSHAMIDPDRIEQVLMNLLTNAVKYGVKGEPIQVHLSEGPLGLRIAVRNRGEPIPEEELPLVFDRFHRMERAKASRVPGVGLGLYIAKGLIEAHEGRIEAESDPSGFNIFWFELPRGTPYAATRPEEAAPPTG